MTLELADRSITNFDADPRVPLILGRSFLKTGKALIDMFEGELTLRVGKEAITCNLDQTSRYSANYNDMTAKRIDVIDMTCEEYSQEILGFSDTILSGNPTPFYDPVVSTTSLTLTPFGNSDFLLEEVDAFLAVEDEPTRLSLPDLTPTCLTLELADRSISRLVGVAEDVYVKIGSFHFLADFVVVEFDAYPRVPLILGRSFLKTRRDLIDVFEDELTLRVGKEAITFNLDQTLRYSANYSDMTAKRIDVIDMACEEYSQDVLGFSDTISSGNPTPYYDPIVYVTSSTLTPFENSDFLLEEVDAFLAIEVEPTSSEFHQPYLDPEGAYFF
nr:reverse transcriptase domain-containing protein [Tanacetum cinerariifolium]